MHLTLSTLALCATIGSVNAAYLPIFTTPSRQVANFDDIPGETVLAAQAPPKPYKLLSYTAIGVGASAPGALALQASSKPNFSLAPYLSGGLATPEISSSYSGSKVVSFDMESIASGCYAATHQGAAAPPISCTIRFTGTKTSGEQVTFDAAFVVDNPSLLGVGLSGQSVQTKRFPSNFKGLTSLKPNILTAALPAIDGVTAEMGFDDITYTAHVKR